MRASFLRMGCFGGRKKRGFHTPAPPWSIWAKMKGEGQDFFAAMSQSANSTSDRSMFQEAIERENISHAT